jgi:hypothetical protein
MEAVYIDASVKCTANVSDYRDLEVIKSRVENEGISFLTITLPQFCKDFERSLEIGFVDSTAFAGFAKVGSIPAFLQGMISHIFDRETGRIFSGKQSNNDGTNVPSSGMAPGDISTLIESVRQICLTFKKVEIECTPNRVSSTLKSFTEIERSFDMFSLPESEKAKFLAVSDVLWHNLVSSCELSECTPKHGPGATADHISGNQKYIWRRWHDRLEPYFHLIGDGYPIGLPPESDVLEFTTIIPKDEEQPVRVTPVPKTLKGPRIIAIEPCCQQFVQQGIRDLLYSKIESYWLTKGHINFRDQTVNQKLAMTSSKTGQLATIDLSDASDRVPLSLSIEMFRSNPDFRDAIEACRTKNAQLPDGTIIGPLRKFASMGSALCFPVEAMYFYTVCVVALLEIQNLPVSPRNVFNVSRGLYVYGDDIVVSAAYAVSVLDHLRKYNCKVNDAKTFYRGNFRESCGIDAYNGYEVTPTYLRKEHPENRQQADRLISWSATANSFYLKGYWRTATFMFKQLERILGNIPYVSRNSPAIGRISYLGFRSAERWNESLQRLEIKAFVPSPVYRKDKLSGYGALSKYFASSVVPKERPVQADARPRWTSIAVGSLLSENYPPIDKRHLERSARHGAVTLKHRWVPSLF